MSQELDDDARQLIRDALAAELPAGNARRAALRHAVLSRAAVVGTAAAVAPDLAGASAGAPPAVPGSPSVIPGAGAIGALLAKGAALGLVAAGVLHGTSHFVLQSSPASVQSHTASAPFEALPISPTVDAPVPNAPISSPAASLVPLRASSASVHSVPAPPSIAVATSSQPPNSSPNSSSLRDELALMGAVQAALRDGRPARALELAERHATLYPHGQLENERLAAVAIAACQNGAEAPARRAAQAFLERDGSSALADRVRSVCRMNGDERGR